MAFAWKNTSFDRMQGHETSIVKISSNSATSMHREHASATSNARLFQLQQQYNALSGISCFVSTYTSSSIP
jgi:hypothetical protein